MKRFARFFGAIAIGAAVIPVGLVLAQVRAGQAYGATDPEGAKVTNNPVTVPDYFATLAHLLGMDPKREEMSPVGRPIAISDNGTAVAGLIASS